MEVVRELIRRNGNQAHRTAALTRAFYFLAKSEATTGLFSVWRTAEREALFQWVGPIPQGRQALFAEEQQAHRHRERARRHPGPALPVVHLRDAQRMGFTNLYGAQLPADGDHARGMAGPLDATGRPGPREELADQRRADA